MLKSLYTSVCCQLPGSILNSLLPVALSLSLPPHDMHRGRGKVGMYIIYHYVLTKNYIPSRKKTSFFDKLNQTHSILLQFTQDLHLLTAYYANPEKRQFSFRSPKSAIYQAQLVPVMTISILRISLARVEEAEVSHFTKRDLYL